MPFQTLFADFWPLTLIALMLAVAAFPLVYVFSALYRFLRKRFAGVPPIALMLLCTFLGALAALFLAYAYLDVSLSRFLPGTA